MSTRRHTGSLAFGSGLLGLLVVVLVLMGFTSAWGDATHQASIPARIRAALLLDAGRVATADGELHPTAIEAVLTTHGKAGRGGGEQSSPPAAGTPVYIVAMRGHFHCNTCSHPPGARIAPGTVITLELLASSMQQLGFELSNQYPNLKAAGVPVKLDAQHGH